MIDYVSFLQKIEKFTHLKLLNASESLSNLASQIKSFLQKHSISLKELLKTLIDHKTKDFFFEDSPNKQKVHSFALLLYPHIESTPKDSFDNFEALVQKIDIDNDGYIDYYDLEIFLKRYKYIEPLKQRPSTQIKSRDSFVRNEERSFVKSQSLFPKIPLSEGKFDEIISNLKKVIIERKITYFEVFQRLDSNEDGFLTINEFIEGIDRFLRLSLIMKEGLFAYFDSLRIGMVDYPQFLAGLKKPPNTKKVLYFFC